MENYRRVLNKGNNYYGLKVYIFVYRSLTNF